MKNLFLVLFAVSVISVNASANPEEAPVSIDASYATASSDGQSEYRIRFVKGGKIEVTTNPNQCTGIPGHISCTTIGLIRTVVRPTVAHVPVIEETRVFQLTPRLRLAVLGGLESPTTLTLIELHASGETRRELPLSLQVFAQSIEPKK